MLILGNPFPFTRPRVAGGYKALRHFLIDTQAKASAECDWIVLTGMTGSGKTHMLAHITQAVDLEGHARHRGSSFGQLPGGQPGNIDFENRLAIELLQRRNRGESQFVLEDESRLIGRCALPLNLYEAMCRAPLVVVEVPQEEYGQVAFKPEWARIRHLINPALLEGMTPLDEAAPDQANWYETREGRQRTRILWSSRWQLPLVVESASLDGYRSYRMEVTLKPLPKTLPWQQLARYQTLDLRDFFD